MKDLPDYIPYNEYRSFLLYYIPLSKLLKLLNLPNAEFKMSQISKLSKMMALMKDDHDIKRMENVDDVHILRIEARNKGCQKVLCLATVEKVSMDSFEAAQKDVRYSAFSKWGGFGPVGTMRRQMALALIDFLREVHPTLFGRAGYDHVNEHITGMSPWVVLTNRKKTMRKGVFSNAETTGGEFTTGLEFRHFRALNMVYELQNAIKGSDCLLDEEEKRYVKMNRNRFYNTKLEEREKEAKRYVAHADHF